MYVDLVMSGSLLLALARPSTLVLARPSTLDLESQYPGPGISVSWNLGFNRISHTKPNTGTNESTLMANTAWFYPILSIFSICNNRSIPSDYLWLILEY